MPIIRHTILQNNVKVIVPPDIEVQSYVVPHSIQEYNVPGAREQFEFSR